MTVAISTTKRLLMAILISGIPMLMMAAVVYVSSRRLERRLAKIGGENQPGSEPVYGEADAAPICRTDIIGAQAAVVAIYNHLFSCKLTTMADVAAAPPENMPVLLSYIEFRMLMLALMDTPAEQQDLIIRHMSSRAQGVFREEMQNYRVRGIIEDGRNTAQTVSNGWCEEAR